MENRKIDSPLLPGDVAYIKNDPKQNQGLVTKIEITRPNTNGPLVLMYEVQVGQVSSKHYVEELIAQEDEINEPV